MMSERRKRGRPPAPVPKVIVRVRLTEPTVRELERMVAVGFFGATVPEVVARIVEGELARLAKENAQKWVQPQS